MGGATIYYKIKMSIAVKSKMDFTIVCFVLNV
jgi:hypothetical protein